MVIPDTVLTCQRWRVPCEGEPVSLQKVERGCASLGAGVLQRYDLGGGGGPENAGTYIS